MVEKRGYGIMSDWLREKCIEEGDYENRKSFV